MRIKGTKNNATLRVQQLATDYLDVPSDEAYYVRRVNLDGAAVDHHLYGMLESLPDYVGLEDVLFAEFCRRAEDGLVEMLEEFLEKRVRGHADADFGALHVEPAGNVRVGGQNKCVRAWHARFHDVEREVVDAGIFGRAADVGYDERHEELLHRLLEGVKLVDCLRGFCIAADGIAGFGGVEYQRVVFEGGCGEFHDSRLRVYGVYFKTHGDNINNLLHFGAIKEKGAVL